jgi:nucleoside-diphosphate-sugar epimerase
MALIIGCGYTGRKIAARLAKTTPSLAGVVSSADSAGRLAPLGLRVIQADLDQPLQDDLTRELGLAEQIHYLAPPPGTGTSDPRLGRVLAALGRRPTPCRLVYTGTTGVYGDCGDEWVDEERPLNPTTERAQRRAHAEGQLLAWQEQTGNEPIILRVAGIYGPDRLPLASLRRGTPVVDPAEAPFSNRIHVDDLVQACLAAMERGRPGRAYNVADGHPTTSAEYYQLLADLAGLPRPPRISWLEAQKVLPPGVLSFLRENRRIDNRRLREELSLELIHPDPASGLRASLAQQDFEPPG